MLCRFVKGLMEDAGMSIREDAMGNIWARWEGLDADAGEIPEQLHHNQPWGCWSATVACTCN